MIDMSTMCQGWGCEAGSRGAHFFALSAAGVFATMPNIVDVGTGDMEGTLKWWVKHAAYPQKRCMDHTLWLRKFFSCGSLSPNVSTQSFSTPKDKEMWNIISDNSMVACPH